MNRTLNLLKREQMTLIVSIPENSYEYAKACWENGADVIKVHCNVFHHASNNHFGSLEELKPVFEKILKDSPVPVGIVAGQDAFIAEGAIDEIVKMGFDFISLYGHHTPATLVARNDISNFFAVDYTYSFDEIKEISNSPLADILEMSIVNGAEYGQRLNARDLAKYRLISKNSSIPTVVPTQRVVKPEDLPTLKECGVKGIMIGAIVTGKHLESVAATTKAFADKIKGM
jgi:hypothetical protein